MNDLHGKFSEYVAYITSTIVKPRENDELEINCFFIHKESV